MHTNLLSGEVHRHLALHLESQNDRTTTVSMPVRTTYDQGTGVVHGGILGALADATGVVALAPHRPFGQSITSIEFKINFLRPARLGGGDLVAVAKVVRSGQTVAVCDVEISQGDKAIAKGLFTYLFFTPRSRA